MAGPYSSGLTMVDVYKRQLRACARGLGTALADLGPQHNRPVAVLVNHTAVSYTHLDVYKRQTLNWQ